MRGTSGCGILLIKDEMMPRQHHGAGPRDHHPNLKSEKHEHRVITCMWILKYDRNGPMTQETDSQTEGRLLLPKRAGEVGRRLGQQM